MAGAIDHLKTLPADGALGRMEVELKAAPDKELRLSHVLDGLRDGFDYIIIDSPPALNLLATNAIAAADSLLISLQCELSSLSRLVELLEQVQRLRRRISKDIHICGLLLTMFSTDGNESLRIDHEIRRHFKQLLFKSVIPKSLGLRESAARGQPLLLRDLKSAGAVSYLNLAKELIHRKEKQP